MATVPNVRIRLAAPGSSGSNLYNSYQVLAQVGALYVKAQTGEQKPAFSASWTWLSDSALSDLGILVNVWQAQTREKNPDLAKLDGVDMTARIERLCRRIEVIESRCTLWTSTASYVRLLLLCEKHIQRIFRNFSQVSPEVSGLFGGVIDSGQRRMEKLRILFGDVKKGMSQLDDNYHPVEEVSKAS